MAKNYRRARIAGRRRRRQEHSGSTRRIVLVLVLAPVLLAFLVAGAITIGLQAAAAVGKDLPKLQDQKQVTLAQTSRIFAADGSLLSYLHGTENRTVVPGDQIPKKIKDAVVAIEDERFYTHKGVDPKAILRALYKDLQAGKTVEGASTITQQLVGNLYLDRRDTSFTRKIREISLAMQLESKLSKQEILNQYLNTVYFGSNAYGIEAASRTYFDKYPKDLTLPEAALLAGLPQAPTAYSPRQHPAAAKNRRNEVLQAMLKNNFITYEDYVKASAAPAQLAPASPYTTVHEPYVVEYVRKQLTDMFGQDAVFKGGLTVETSINPAYQQLAQQAIKSVLSEPGDPTAAIASVDTKTGWVRAMVSGSDYQRSKFNLAAQGRRQPGSAFKTFALVAAVEQGMDPSSTYYTSAPQYLDIPGSREPWIVSTYGNTYSGPISLVQATLKSDNTVYAQLALDVGASNIVDVAHRMGITSQINVNPAIVLGGLKYGVSPLEMASAYATLPNGGRHVQPTVVVKVTNANGEVLYQAKPKETQAISASTAYTVTRILEMNVQSGTGTRAQLDRPAAGKTGTAQDYADAWFAGFIPQLSTAVWVGYPQGRISMNDVHGIRVAGGTFPAEIWYAFMSSVEGDFPAMDFGSPDQQGDTPVTTNTRSTRHRSSTTVQTGQASSTTTARQSARTSSTRRRTVTTRPATTRTSPPATHSTEPPATTRPPTTRPPRSSTTRQSPPSTRTPTTAVPPSG
jgi:penicillin-binding protein 1A